VWRPLLKNNWFRRKARDRGAAELGKLLKLDNAPTRAIRMDGVQNQRNKGGGRGAKKIWSREAITEKPNVLDRRRQDRAEEASRATRMGTIRTVGLDARNQNAVSSKREKSARRKKPEDRWQGNRAGRGKK